ncbi:MAG: hypothetical protein LBF81_00580 [Prevotellaceae bacterium]|nr:hypothetical protein [Prevotellaceae bacterium]
MNNELNELYTVIPSGAQRSREICCVLHLVLCTALRLGADPSATRLVPRRSGRNDGAQCNGKAQN